MTTPGGRRLRMLRKARNQTIEGIAVDAGITYKTLSEIERGITKQPSKETIEKILDALDVFDEVSTEERQTIFEMYGYKRPYPLPTDAEIELAVKHWREAHSQIPYPAYLVDISQRLLAWNKYAVRLLGIRSNDPRVALFQGVTIFDVTFGLANSWVEIVNRDEYLPDLVRTMKAEMEPFKHEAWYDECINNARKCYPEFRKLWDAIADGSLALLTMGNAVPIVLRIPQEGELKFQLSRVGFTTDPRFLIVQWTPLDETTMRKCILWKQEEDDLI